MAPRGATSMLAGSHRGGSGLTSRASMLTCSRQPASAHAASPATPQPRPHTGSGSHSLRRAGSMGKARGGRKHRRMSSPHGPRCRDSLRSLPRRFGTCVHVSCAPCRPGPWAHTCRPLLCTPSCVCQRDSCRMAMQPCRCCRIVRSRASSRARGHHDSGKHGCHRETAAGRPSSHTACIGQGITAAGRLSSRPASRV